MNIFLYSQPVPAISFTLSGKDISCELARNVSKDYLYGRLKKLTIKEDEVLRRGYLTVDGRCVSSSTISNGKLDPKGTPVDRKESLKVTTEYVYTEARALLDARLADNVRKGWEKA